MNCGTCSKKFEQSRAPREVQSAKFLINEAYKLDKSLPKIQIQLIGGGSNFDYFFDNVFIDLMSRNKINDSKRSVMQRISELEPIISQRRKHIVHLQKKTLDTTKAELNDKRRLLTKIRIDLMKRLIEKG